MEGDFLIVGLGNPGKEYEESRHNIGFRAVDEFARRYGLTLRKKLFMKGRLAHGLVEGQKVFLLQPQTYMNLSGDAVTRVMRKQNIALEKLLVIVDDVALPFGQLRLRTQSGSGGHNGLKSIEEKLGTIDYARLRIGVGDRQEGDLASHVLAPFSREEEKLVPGILERASDVVKIWLTEGLTSAMNHANAKI
jgi:peptidyl-tRNA hydrolase, PTH1 family